MQNPALCYPAGARHAEGSGERLGGRWRVGGILRCSAPGYGELMSERDDEHSVGSRPALPTCAEIGAALRDDFIEADSLDPVELVLTAEDTEGKAWCSWKDIPTGKSIFIGAEYRDTVIEDITERRGAWEVGPDYRIETPHNGVHPGEIFVINEGSAEVYEPGCEVQLVYITPSFAVRISVEDYDLDAAQRIALRVAELMRS